MTILHPCFHCHRKANCPIKTETAKALRGLDITKASIRCKIPKQDFPPGAIVDVEAFKLVDGGYFDEGYRTERIVRRAIVSRWNRDKITVVLDKDQEIEQPERGAIGYLNVTSDRLTRVAAPIAALCECGLAQARCESLDYPSIREGEFQCWTRQLDAAFA